MEKKLMLLIGLPRSGKSTWAKSQNHPVVNPDSIRLAIHGHAYIPKAEPLVWATAKIMVAALFLAGHNKVVMDATNLTEESRSKWLSDDWECVYNAFHTPKEICIERAIASGTEYLIPVIEEMAVTMDIPETLYGDIVVGSKG